MRILLVEDSRTACELICASLESHTVITVNEPGEAIAMLRKIDPVDLIVLDYFLPGITNGQLVRMIQQLYPSARIVIFTSEPKRVERDSIPQGIPVIEKFNFGELLEAGRTGAH